MTGVRRFGVAVFGALLASIGLAPPASALLPPADGYYTFDMEGVPQARWAMQSLCSQASGTREQSDYTDQTIQTQGCRVLVTATTPRVVTQEEHLSNFAGWAVLTNGMWTFQILQHDAVVCPDGSTQPQTDTYSFTSPDPNGPPNLTGVHTDIHPAVCGLPAAMHKTPFTLTFRGPLEDPVINRFPMQCDFLVGRPSICA